MSQQPLADVSILLYANVAAAGALAQQNPQLTHDRIRRVLRRLGATIARYQGRLCEQHDDALSARFERAQDAVSAALAFQETQRAYIDMIEDGIEPEVQVGIVLGEVVVSGGRVSAAATGPAQRLAQLAGPGGVCMSAAIGEALPERFPLEMERLNAEEVEGAQQPLEAYRVGVKDGAELTPPGHLRKARTLQPVSTMRAFNRFLLLLIAAALIFAYLSAPG